MRIALRLSGLVAATALAGLQTVSAAASSNQMEVPAPNMANPCNGELVLTTGTVHMSLVSNARHLHVRSNFQDVKGVGSVTGFDYVITGSSQIVHGNFNFSKRGQDEFTTLTILHIIAPSNGQHFSETLLVHFNLTPSGHTSFTSNGAPRCLGMSSGHLVVGERVMVGERVKDTSSVVTGDGATTAAAPSAPTAGAATAGPGSKAASRESAQGAANGVRSHGLNSKAH
jgi:hypothetical protein